ncbi:pheromone A receptor-domain-containing protein [Immersiella caudata]|uniref:Pheromone A receptor-domain-containing protein n=1 Tax=Immersiella caudata TaxID=314043 RepID=A0AA40C2Y2_9PEZI|nr:pheromone A receptor-domain-containing protein [Immersiella caudata]
MNWTMFGFTTTPEQRLGPPPPYTNPALQANLFFRVFLGIFAVLISGVPARLLWRNGEFAATVFCVAVLTRNTGYIINALIWRDDNVATWYDGKGWCDLQVYINFASDTAFNTCLFEIMRSLCSIVGLDRVASMTSRERFRQQIISAAVIFTIPVVQVALSCFLMLRRYNISTLVGCTTIYHFDWVFFVFYVLPTPAFVVLAAILAVVVFIRFRRIERMTQVIHSYDTVMSARRHRVRRKLYFMTLGILVIVVPLICALFILNVRDGYEYWSDPYDYELIVHGPDPFNHDFISFTTSDMVRFVDMNINYIPTLAALVIFAIFGMTTEGLNDYRRLLLFFGLGYIFPKLNEEYNPDSQRSRSGWLSSFSRIFPIRATRLSSQGSHGSHGSHGSSGTKNPKSSRYPTVDHISNASAALTSRNQEKGDIVCSGANRRTTGKNPWPDLSNLPESEPTSSQTKIPDRNPWLFRTSLPSAPFRIPAISLPTPSKKGSTERLVKTASRTYSAPPPGSPPRNKTAGPKAAEEDDIPSPNPHTQDDTDVWTGNGPAAAHVSTRVWASESGRASWDQEASRDTNPSNLGVVRVRTEMRVASTMQEAVATSIMARMQAGPATGRS